MKIEKEIVASFDGLNQVQVIAFKNIIKGILFDSLKSASKKVYDSGADRELLIKVYNEMMADFKNN